MVWRAAIKKTQGGEFSAAGQGREMTSSRRPGFGPRCEFSQNPSCC